MLNDFIGGGQVFLHKIRMFLQVAGRSLSIAFLISILLVGAFKHTDIMSLNWADAFVYTKAYLSEGVSEAGQEFKLATGQRASKNETMIKEGRKNGIATYTLASTILKDRSYIKAKNEALALLYSCLLAFVLTILGVLSLIFAIWSRLGGDIRKDKQTAGSAIKTAKEVATYLARQGKASNFKIAGMPLVKDAEVRHLLITGTTGSGKTNLINTLLPQVFKQNHPALILDQTGEMIAKYYDESRGDIIFNPLDARSHSWDFFKDIGADEHLNINNPVRADLEKFAKVLFNFGKSSHNSADPFWSNSAESVFCACVESLIRRKDGSCNIRELQRMLTNLPAKSLKDILIGSEGARYLDSDNKNTAASILSVMTAATKPLNYLTESSKSFSLKEHFSQIQNGSRAVLFLSTPPGQREPLIPLISCIFELVVSKLMSIGINEQRRLWFIIDELAALGKLGGITTLLNEGRKYGACLVASTQSLSQIYDIYGYHMGSSIFTQFATKFFFRNDEPQIAKIITDIFGQIEYQTKQKNTSFGAHEHRDGVSYTESEKRKPLITTDKLATLSDLECLVGLPDPEVRIVQIKLLKVKNLPNLSEGYLPKTKTNTGTDQDKALSPKFRAKIAAQDEGEIKNEIAKESQSLNQVLEGEQEDNIDWDSTRDKEDAIKSGKIKTQGKIQKREEGLEMACDRLIERLGQGTAKNSRESSTENQKGSKGKPEPELENDLTM